MLLLPPPHLRRRPPSPRSTPSQRPPATTSFPRALIRPRPLLLRRSPGPTPTPSEAPCALPPGERPPRGLQARPRSPSTFSELWGERIWQQRERRQRREGRWPERQRPMPSAQRRSRPPPPPERRPRKQRREGEGLGTLWQTSLPTTRGCWQRWPRRGSSEEEEGGALEGRRRLSGRLKRRPLRAPSPSRSPPLRPLRFAPRTAEEETETRPMTTGRRCSSRLLASASTTTAARRALLRLAATATPTPPLPRRLRRSSAPRSAPSSRLRGTPCRQSAPRCC